MQSAQNDIYVGAYVQNDIFAWNDIFVRNDIMLGMTYLCYFKKSFPIKKVFICGAIYL